MKKKHIELRDRYASDPESADRRLWGREADATSRRGFLQRSALLAMSTVLGAKMVYGANFPAGMIPAAFANNDEDFALPGKNPELIILNDKPINAETPAHLLDDKRTPADLFFVRNNGIEPTAASIDPNTWTLTIEGESAKSTKTYTLPELKKRFKHYTYDLVLECGGNGRKEFNPPAKGNQWDVGAVGCAAWTGVRLRDVLEDVGIAQNAMYIGYYGKDTHLNGDPDKVTISRGVSIDKAMQEESLIAWAINGQDIPLLNGYPLRLVFGGSPASTSGKWLHRIVIRDKVHDGEKMLGQSYRIPCKPVAPGASVAEEDMCIIEKMPVKSLITYPRSGATIRLGQTLPLRGQAWAGELNVRKMEYSIDFGATWHPCSLNPPVNRMAWQQWNAKTTFPQEGYYEVWARATDSEGIGQPMVLPGWNPRGYLNNACHRIAVKVVK